MKKLFDNNNKNKINQNIKINQTYFKKMLNSCEQRWIDSMSTCVL